MNPNPTPSPITATKTPPRPRTMRTPVHPNHKRAHTHAAPNHMMPAGRRHPGWWIGGVLRERHPEIGPITKVAGSCSEQFVCRT